MNSGSFSPKAVGIWAAIGALLADQLSKLLLLYGLGFAANPETRVPVTPFFDLVMVWNRGISYGLFQAQGLLGTVLLTAFSLVAMAALGWWLTRAERRILGFGLGLIIGGAIGNVIDRVCYGAVADFFYFHALGRGWYVFNIADAAITIGVLALLADAFGASEEAGPTREPDNRNG
jgi:signal peptidase II